MIIILQIGKGTAARPFHLIYYFLFENILLRSSVAKIIIPITINIAIIPESIYFKFATKAIGLKPLNIIYLLHKEVKDKTAGDNRSNLS